MPTLDRLSFSHAVSGDSCRLQFLHWGLDVFNCFLFVSGF